MSSTRSVRTPRQYRRAPSEQLPLFKKHGGARRGAGRPPKRARAGVPHGPRPVLRARHPVHVVLRVVSEVGSLRRRDAYHAIRWATHVTARREDFRIVQLSIQRTHVHLLVEANDQRALAKGMQGFQVSAAKLLNAAMRTDGRRRRGGVFQDRYHATVITTPRQARHVLLYVLSNWRKHGEDRAEKVRDWKLDWFSSAPLFPDWTEYGDEAFLWPFPPTYEPLLVFRPRTWLLREGWKKHGDSLSYLSVPAAGH